MKNLKVIFTREMHTFLIQEGYTHVYNKGVVNSTDEVNEENGDEYIIIPLKPDDVRLKYQETDMMIEEINNDEVLDMADGDPFIRFSVEIPVIEYKKYLKS